MARLFIAILVVLVAVAAGLVALLVLGDDDEDDGNGDGDRVQLFYYDPERDKDAEGNVLCSERGLVGVERDIELDDANIEETILLLLRGELSAEERGRGITTEFPLDGFELDSSRLEAGRLTLVFDDPDGSSSGGACRVRVLAAQVSATAEQFAGVTEVVFEPDSVFQP